jgi:hypothetical protein
MSHACSRIVWGVCPFRNQKSLIDSEIEVEDPSGRREIHLLMNILNHPCVRLGFYWKNLSEFGQESSDGRLWVAIGWAGGLVGINRLDPRNAVLGLEHPGEGDLARDSIERTILIRCNYPSTGQNQTRIGERNDGHTVRGARTVPECVCPRIPVLCVGTQRKETSRVPIVRLWCVGATGKGAYDLHDAHR